MYVFNKIFQLNKFFLHFKTAKLGAELGSATDFVLTETLKLVSKIVTKLAKATNQQCQEYEYLHIAFPLDECGQLRVLDKHP